MRTIIRLLLPTAFLLKGYLLFSQTMTSPPLISPPGFKGMSFNMTPGPEPALQAWMTINPGRLQYEFKADSVTDTPGGPAIAISGHSLQAPPAAQEFYGLINKWPLLSYPGNQLLMTGYAKGDGITSPEYDVTCWFTDAKGNTLQTVHPASKPALHDKWEKLSLQATIPAKAKYIITGITFRSTKKIWLANFNLIVNGSTTSIQRSATTRQSGTDTKAQPLESFTAPGARLIALGEYCHGSTEILNTSFKLIKTLIGSGQCNTVILETGMDVAQVLNDYVHGKEADLANTMKLAGTPLYNEPFYEFIQWIKTYNQSTTSKISLAGIDMQLPVIALQTILQQYPQHAGHIDSLYSIVEEVFTGTPVNDSIVALLQQQLRLFRQLPADDGTILVQQFIGHLIRQKATDLSGKRTFGQGGYRDSCMAENVLRMMERLPSMKPVLLAHNGHVQYQEGVMGGYLRKKLGNAYQSYAFITGTGSCISTINMATGQSSTQIIPPSPVGSLEKWLEKTGQEGFFSFGNSLAAKDSWTNQPFLFNLLGLNQSAAMQYTWTVVPREAFNGIFYLPHSTAAPIHVF